MIRQKDACCCIYHPHRAFCDSLVFPPLLIFISSVSIVFDQLVSLFSDCFLEIKWQKKSRLASVSRLINRTKQANVVSFSHGSDETLILLSGLFSLSVTYTKFKTFPGDHRVVYVLSCLKASFVPPPSLAAPPGPSLV